MDSRRAAPDQHKPGDAALLAANGETGPDHEGAKHTGASHQPAICLVVDDFGLHAGIDTAVMRLIELGRVHAVSCMVGGASWQANGPTLAARVRRPDLPRVDMGLHLDFTEAALHPAWRQPLGRLIVKAYLGRLDRRALDAEIESQLEGFERVTGRAPDYIDGHQHVHQLPGIREALLAALQARWPRHRPWLRSTRNASAEFKPWVIQALGSAALGALAAPRGYRMNRRLLGVYDFTADTGRYREHLLGWIEHARHGDLLMCHPGEAGPPGAMPDGIAAARQTELAVLAGDDWLGALRQRGLSLQAMSEILG